VTYPAEVLFCRRSHQNLKFARSFCGFSLFLMDAKFIKISGLLKVISRGSFHFRTVLSCNRVISGEGKYQEAGKEEGSDCFRGLR